jgi:diacylglycerol kinase (ATP)
MKTIVIANPKAAAGRVGRDWSRYERAIFDRFGQCGARMTSRKGHATDLVAESVSEGVGQIVLVGGDGTLGEAVNGLKDPNTGELCANPPVFALVPAGTGGDFARSLGMKGLSPEDALRLVEKRPIDLGRIEFSKQGEAPGFHYFINEASLGASATIVQKVNESSKMLGGKASFYLGTLKGLSAWRDRRVRLRVDDAFDQELVINSIAITNGRYFGGGMKVAPDALLDDGLLDVVVIGSAGVFKFLRQAPKLYAGAHKDLPEFTFLKGEVVEVEAVDRSEKPVPFETDGENPGSLPIKCAVVPRALELFAPWHRAEAIESR